MQPPPLWVTVCLGFLIGAMLSSVVSDRRVADVGLLSADDDVNGGVSPPPGFTVTLTSGSTFTFHLSSELFFVFLGGDLFSMLSRVRMFPFVSRATINNHGRAVRQRLRGPRTF